MILSKLVVTLLTATVTFSARSRRERSNSEDGFIPLTSNLTMDGILNYYSYTDDETFTMGDIDPYNDGPFVSASPIERRNQQTITVDLQYCQARQFEYDNVFVAELTIYDTVFRVKIDTGSSDLWVASKGYQPPAGIQKTTLDMVKLKSELKSQQKSKKPIYVTHVGKYRPNHGAWGLLKGDLPNKDSRAYQSEVTFGGVTVTGQQYGALAGFTEDFNKQPYDGILGLAFPPLAFNGEKSVISQLLRQHGLNRVWALYLAKTGSKLFVGWLGDPALFDESRIEYYPVVKVKTPKSINVKTSYWALHSGKVKVGEEVIAEKLRTLIVSGTDMIFGPREDVKKIYDKIETAFLTKNGHWVFMCNLNERPFPKISFSWGRKDWTLTLDSFILFRSNFKTKGSSSKVSDIEHVCLGAIQVMPEGKWPSGTWVLGNSFMNNAHVVFNEEKSEVGLAPRKIHT